MVFYSLPFSHTQPEWCSLMTKELYRNPFPHTHLTFVQSSFKVDCLGHSLGWLYLQPGVSDSICAEIVPQLKLKYFNIILVPYNTAKLRNTLTERLTLIVSSEVHSDLASYVSWRNKDSYYLDLPGPHQFLYRIIQKGEPDSRTSVNIPLLRSSRKKRASFMRLIYPFLSKVYSIFGLCPETLKSSLYERWQTPTIWYFNMSLIFETHFNLAIILFSLSFFFVPNVQFYKHSDLSLPHWVVIKVIHVTLTWFSILNNQ